MANNESTETTDPNAPVTPPPAEAPVIAPKASSGIAQMSNCQVVVYF